MPKSGHISTVMKTIMMTYIFKMNPKTNESILCQFNSIQTHVDSVTTKYVFLHSLTIVFPQPIKLHALVFQLQTHVFSIGTEFSSPMESLNKLYFGSRIC